MMEFDSFWSDVAATLVGGVVLAFIFFIVRERLKPLPRVSGAWTLIATYTSSAYNPYKGLVVEYQVHLIQSGATLMGSAEKIRELNGPKGAVEYSKTARTQAIINGVIDKRYVSRSIIELHFREAGEQRPYTTFFSIKKELFKQSFAGTWHSTAGESSGTCEFVPIKP